MTNVSVCIEKLTTLFSCPRMNFPINKKRKPVNSANQARKVIWIFILSRRCLLSFEASSKVFLNLFNDSLWCLEKIKTIFTYRRLFMSKYLATLNIKEFFSLPSHMCENSIVDNAFCEVGSKDEK